MTQEGRWIFRRLGFWDNAQRRAQCFGPLRFDRGEFLQTGVEVLAGG